MRVLVLDDEPAIVSSFCDFLRKHGHHTYGVTSHEEAIAVAEVFRPHVFISGFANCCERNGCETALEIVDMLRRCRVLIASGAAYRLALAVAQQYRNRGYDFTVWEKPFRIEDLLAWLSSPRQRYI